MGRREIRVPGRTWRRHPHGFQTAAELRHARRYGAPACSSEKCRPERPEELPGRGQSQEAARHARQSEWTHTVRNGCSVAGNASCRGGTLPGVRREGRQLRRDEGQSGARRAPGHTGFQWNRRRRGQHLVGDGGPPRARSQMGRRPERLGEQREHQQAFCGTRRTARRGRAQGG